MTVVVRLAEQAESGLYLMSEFKSFLRRFYLLFKQSVLESLLLKRRKFISLIYIKIQTWQFQSKDTIVADQKEEERVIRN